MIMEKRVMTTDMITIMKEAIMIMGTATKHPKKWKKNMGMDTATIRNPKKEKKTSMSVLLTATP